MEPRIQYAHTADGVSIAFWTLGEGVPFVHLSVLYSHIQLEWQLPECRRWYERLAEQRRLVRFDPRNFGLSQRNVTDFSLEVALLDLEAVVDRLGLEKFTLCGLMVTGPIAIAYAARHPERVSELILWCTYARASDWSRLSHTQAVRALMDKDWVFYSETAAHSLLGWSAGEPARRYAALIRESITPEDLRGVVAAINQFDVTPLLPQVTAPTLLLYRRQYALDVDVARGLASRIPDCRLALLEGDAGAPYIGDVEAALAAIGEFLGEGQPSATAAAPSGLVTILFTDIEGSTALTQRLGDAKAQELLHAHNSIVRDALKSHSGSEIKHTGDGIMASFPAASPALECAVAIQRAVEAWNEARRGGSRTAPTEADLGIRIGLNAGEPVVEEADLFGTAVQLARRICDQAEGGEILASNVVRELAAGKGFLFADRGETALRGFEDPVRLYEIRWREER